jgi:hypothetical protein
LIDHCLGGIHAVHVADVSEANQKSHSGTVAAAEIHSVHPCANTRLFGQVHGRLKAADVNLLTHDEFPQLTFRTAVDLLNVAQTDVRCGFHAIDPRETRKAYSAEGACRDGDGTSSGKQWMGSRREWQTGATSRTARILTNSATNKARILTNSATSKVSDTPENGRVRA